jgi:hypothetical protein
MYLSICRRAQALRATAGRFIAFDAAGLALLIMACSPAAAVMSRPPDP